MVEAGDDTLVEVGNIWKGGKRGEAPAEAGDRELEDLLLGDTRGEAAWDPPEDNEEKEVEATRPLSLDLSSSSPSRGGVGGVTRTGLKAEASLSRPCRKRACWASSAAGYPSPGNMSGRKGAEADRSMVREVGEGGGVRAPGCGGAGEPTTAITGSWTLLNEKSATVQVYSLSPATPPPL
jgi:hypothetical protein